MRNSKMNVAGLMAIAALAAAGSGIATPSPRYTNANPRRTNPKIRRMVTSASDEIKAWNAAVDAKKAAKGKI